MPPERAGRLQHGAVKPKQREVDEHAIDARRGDERGGQLLEAQDAKCRPGQETVLQAGPSAASGRERHEIRATQMG